MSVGNIHLHALPFAWPVLWPLLEKPASLVDMTEKDVAREIKRLEKLMLEHARNLEFEKAARVRDQLALLKEQAFGAPGKDNVVPIGVAGGLKA